MEKLIEEAPLVAESFFALTKSITDYFPEDKKIKELILIGIFTAHGGIRGIATHIERALEQNATKEEILGSILLAMPVVGISKVNQAIERALEIIEGDKE